MPSCQIPNFSTPTPQWADAFEAANTEREKQLEQLLALENPTFDTFCLPLQRLDAACERLWSTIAHLGLVQDTPETRDAEDRVRILGTAHSIARLDNEAIYRAYEKISQNETGLDEWQAAWLRENMRTYEKRGVGADAATKARLGQITERLSELDIEFGRHVQDAGKQWHVVVEVAQTQNMPETALELFRAAGERHQSPTGLAVDLQGPCMLAAVTHCHDRGVREKVWLGWDNRASEWDPYAADNMPLILEILSLRNELAKLTGYTDYAQYATADKMSATPAAAQDLLLELREKARPKAQIEWQAMQDFAREHLALDNLQAWDSSFVSEQARQKKFGFSASELAAYFPFEQVLDGMLALSKNLFGVSFQQDDTVSTWHETVRFYRVLDEQDNIIAGFYLDPFAREGKRGGAWKMTLHGKIDEFLPIAMLNCNAAPGTEETPALLEHNEVVTLFHEFGHGLHLMLGKSPYPDVDMGGVEHDAIECPSQMFEQFAWDRQSLQSFARHYQTQEPIPEMLLDAMIQARDHNAGMFVIRQLGFGLTDLALHMGDPVRSAEAAWERGGLVNEQTAVIPAPPGGPHYLASFSHIFAGGYAAGYYGYLWAEVLASDVFNAFKEAAGGPNSEDQGLNFRREILEVGAKRPFSESFEAFRGRGPDPSALLATRGLLDTAAKPTVRLG